MTVYDHWIRCSQWREADRQSREVMSQWFYGYVSGASRISGINYLGVGIVPGTEFTATAQIRAYVDQWCAKNPTLLLEQAASALIEGARGPKAAHK